MLAWLTPDDAEIDLVCYQVYLPDDDQMRACFYGAFLLLCEAQNWEQGGTMSVEDAAQLFEECWWLTVPPESNLTECEE